jgi:hypothetical protein
MEDWRWLLWFAVPGGLGAALFGFDRLCLWLEDRGWLYYRRKKPSSSPLSALIAFQQYVEPGVKHVHHAGQARPAAVRERLLACLLNLLGTTPVNVEGIIHCRAAAKRARCSDRRQSGLWSQT